MDLTYYNPLRAQQISVQSSEELSQKLISSLPAGTGVRFLARPFSQDLTDLKNLQVHLEREKLPARHAFMCTVAADDCTEASLEILKQVNFTQLTLEIDLQAPQIDRLRCFFELTRQYHFKVIIILNKQTKPDEAILARLALFLESHLGDFELASIDGLFDSVHQQQRFQKLAVLSKSSHQTARFEAYMNQQFYEALYAFLRMKLPPRTSTVLEINPLASQAFYRDYTRVHLPWKVTLSELKNGQLDREQLKSLGKTFDVVVLFRALPRLRDPQKELLILQKYTRPTTEWVIIQYNPLTLPTLAALSQNQFHNLAPHSPYWKFLQIQSKQSLERLFEFSGLHFEWFPTEVSIQEFAPLIEQLELAIKPEFPLEWDAFLNQAETMMLSAYGTMAESLDEGFDLAEEGFAEGFVTEGFL